MHATEAELQEFAAAHISEFKVPRRIVMLAELPKGPTGKLQRVGVAERLGITFCSAGRRDGPFTEPAGEAERVIARTMATVLGFSSLGATDNFFDLGGTSLHAAELICALRTTQGWNLRLAHLYRRPTAQALAQLVPTIESAESLQLQNPEQALLRFNESGTRPALFFLHSSVEAAACMAELAAHCGPDQPLFVLPAHGANGEPIPPTIEAMAAASVRTIRTLRPTGPYILAGFCRSGAVALETARQFELAGDTVPMLVIISALIDNTHVAMRWLQRLVRLEGLLRRWDGDRCHRRFVAIRRVVERFEAWLPGRRPGAAVPPEEDPIGEAYRIARKGYVPPRYDRPLLLLKPSRRPVDVRWLKVAPCLEMGELPGRHNTCLNEHVPTVCLQLARALTEDRPSAAAGAPGAQPAYTNVN
jgi:thioesterase domain-containing protein